MGVTIEDILQLVGRLDDAPGFDAPRERFRRFLAGHVRTPLIARELIEQCHRTPGEQHQRALQDLVVLLGRFLGFETTCGSYAELASGVKYDGHWRSRSSLLVVIEIRSDQTASRAPDNIVDAMATHSTDASAVALAGLCVLAPPFEHRQRIEQALETSRSPHPVGLVALPSLISLADMAANGRITHEDVVRLITLNVPADFVIDLLTRQAESHDRPRSSVPGQHSRATAGDPGFWIATVGSDYATRPEDFLENVVAKRGVFGVTDRWSESSPVRAGDWVCFYISGLGVVGHARVGALTDDSHGIRDAHRFRQVLELGEITLHVSSPIAIDPETQLHIRAATPTSGRRAPSLVPVTRESFGRLTTPVEAPAPEAGSAPESPEGMVTESGHQAETATRGEATVEGPAARPIGVVGRRKSTSGTSRADRS